MDIRFGRLAALSGLLALIAGGAAATTCDSAAGGGGEVARRAAAFAQTLTPAQSQAVRRAYSQADAIRWSNLPVGIAPRIGLRLGDLNAAQAQTFEPLLRAALSRCGVDLLAEIRAADGVLMPSDTRDIGWNPGNYYVAFIGQPSATKPWGLLIGGHHIAYNLTFNAAQASATPLFDGVEPVEFKAGGRDHAPLAAQAQAMRVLATAIADRPGATLEGEFRDVTRGATDKGDTNFPMTYPTGTAGRGVAYASLGPAQKALVRAAMARWVELPNAAVAGPLMAQYTRESALAQTYVGIAGGADLAKPGAYVRIDGPRLWIEFIVQAAVADRTKVHYHTIWRDKVADYGGAFAP